jgi:hypothetical protein
MIAFVGPSSLPVSATDTVDDRELHTVLDINLGTVQVGIKVDSKLGPVLDRRLLTEVVLNINLGSKLGTVLGRR